LDRSSRTPQDAPPGLARLFASLERTGASEWRWFVLLAVWILARNLVEGVLEQPHVLGFDWRSQISAPMVFLHFPLFYLGVFFIAALWLHLVTRRALTAVAAVVSSGFALLLVAPVIDAIVTGGRGYDLAYLPGWGSTLQRFWNPSAALNEVSPGQRVEIVLACLLAAIYAGAAIAERNGSSRGGAVAARGARPAIGLRSVAGGVLAGAGLFLGCAALGAWPAWFAQLTSPPHAAGAGDPGAAYREVFRGFGLLADESRRHAVALALPVIPLLVAFCWRLDPRRWRGFVRAMSGPRLAHYTGLVPAGAFLGWWLYKDHLPYAFHNPTDWAALAVLWAAMVSAYGAALLWNDRHDRAADAINDPGRPLVTGLVDDRRARAFAWACAAVAGWLALMVGYPTFLLMVACLLLAYLYSTPPLRLKRWPLVATLALGVLSLLSLWSGFALFGQEMTPIVFPRRIALLVVLGVMLGFPAKDLKDVRGDAAMGVHTWATLLGEVRARRLVAACVLASYGLAGLLLPLGTGYWVAAGLLGLASAGIVLRRRHPDDLLLIAFLAFVVLSAVLLGRRPAALLEGGGGAGGWRDLHGEVRRIEEDVRRERCRREGLLPSAAPATASAAVAMAATDALAKTPGRSSPALPQRLRWARCQVSSGMESGDDLRGLLRDEPMNAAYWERLLVVTEELQGPRAAAQVCAAALAVGVRPGDFLRHRAATTLAALRGDAAMQAAGPGATPPAAGLGPALAEGMASAADDLQGAWRFGQERPALATLAGDWAVLQGRPAAAIGHYRQALRARADLSDAWAGLGEALFESSELLSSIAAFERAVALRPDDPWILNNLGVALREAGRASEALAPLLRAARLDPGFFEPAFNLGLTYLRLADLDAAAIWLERARVLRPGFPPVEEALRRLDRGGGGSGRTGAGVIAPGGAGDRAC